jgi:hypothetical protein
MRSTSQFAWSWPTGCARHASAASSRWTARRCGARPVQATTVRGHLWAELHDTLEELRQAVATFATTSTSQWLIGRRLGHEL